MFGRGDQMDQFLAGVGSIRAFVETASPGDVMIYARGAALPRAAETASVVRSLADQGVVVANLRRGSGGCEYLIRKRATSNRPRTPRRGFGLGPLELAVLRLLKRYARTGRCLPTNRMIAAKCGCKNLHDASWRIRKLVAGGLIAVEIEADGSRYARLPGEQA